MSKINASQAIESLRQVGVKVKVRHLRPLDRNTKILLTRWQLEAENEHARKFDFPAPYGFSPFGGETEVSILGYDGVWFVGVAICRKDERFNKKMGLNIAFGRAWKEFATQGLRGEIEYEGQIA